MASFERITTDPARMNGEPCIRNLRLTVRRVLEALALSGAAGPSVIRIRIEALKASELAELLMRVVEQCKDDLSSGAMVAATESGVRLRHLPLIRLR